MRILEPYENYFWDFYNPLKQNVKDKIDYVLQIIISVQQIPTKFFKHLEDGIYEIELKWAVIFIGYLPSSMTTSW